jgi:hypothetical protein
MREERIAQALRRVIASVASGETSPGSGGLFELAYPFVAASVPGVTPEEVQIAFGRLWGIDPQARGFHEHVLAVCDRHSPQPDETIKEVLQRASSEGDLEAQYLLSLVSGPGT